MFSVARASEPLTSPAANRASRAWRQFFERQDLHLPKLDRVALGLEGDVALVEHLVAVLDQRPGRRGLVSSSWGFSYSRTVSPSTMCLMTPLPWTSTSTVTHSSP